MNISAQIKLLIISVLPVICSCREEERPPVAEFEADSTTIEQGNSVQFSDLSLEGPTEWSWKFEAGDPQISTIQHPEVTYHQSGEYEVRLTVSNNAGTDVIVKDNYINVLAPYPEADFIGDTTTIEIDGIVRFSDISKGKPTEWIWTFQGGNPETSTAQNPKVIYEAPGIYSVVLTIKNERGTDTEAKDGYITVRNPRTDLVFRNNVFTDVNLTLEGDTRTLAAGDSITFNDFEGFETTYSAETSGKSTQGLIVGLAIYWQEKIVLNGTKMVVDLDLAKDYFYLYITNNGEHHLAPLYVNFGLPEQTIDNVVMQANGTRYQIGYYRAFSETVIRANWMDDPTLFTKWVQGTDFSLPFSKNQVVYLTNRSK